MTVIVDASVLVSALVDSGKEGRWAEETLLGQPTAAPELVMAETATVLRRLERARLISHSESNSAYRDLMRFNIELFAFSPFAERIWSLRDNLTTYDAWYVALAEALNSPFLQRLTQGSSAPVGHVAGSFHPPELA